MKTVVARTNISHTPYGSPSQTAKVGQEFILPDAEAEPLIASGAVEVVQIIQSELSALGSVELRRRHALLEQRIQLRRDTHAERTELRAAAKRELAALNVRAENGEDVRKEATKAQAHVDELDRGIQSAADALDHVVAESRDEDAALLEAIGQAVRIEAQVQREQEAAAYEAACVAQRRRTMRALAELDTALQEDAALAGRGWRFPNQLREVIIELHTDALTRRANA